MTRLVLKGVYWQLLDSDTFGRREDVRRRSPFNDKLVANIISAMRDCHEHYVRLDLGYTSDPRKQRIYRVVGITANTSPYKRTYVSRADGCSMTVSIDEPHYVISFEDVDKNDRKVTGRKVVTRNTPRGRHKKP